MRSHQEFLDVGMWRRGESLLSACHQPRSCWLPACVCSAASENTLEEAYHVCNAAASTPLQRASLYGAVKEEFR